MSSNNITKFLKNINTTLYNSTSCPLCNKPTHLDLYSLKRCYSCFDAYSYSFTIYKPIPFHFLSLNEHAKYEIYSLDSYIDIDLSNLKDLSLNGLISYISKLTIFS